MQLLASDPGASGRVAMAILIKLFGLIRRFQKQMLSMVQANSDMRYNGMRFHPPEVLLED